MGSLFCWFAVVLCCLYVCEIGLPRLLCCCVGVLLFCCVLFAGLRNPCVVLLVFACLFGCLCVYVCLFVCGCVRLLACFFVRVFVGSMVRCCVVLLF